MQPKVIDPGEVAAEHVYPDAPSKVVKRNLVTYRDDAPNFGMRLFEVEAGGATDHHQHPWEHEVFIVSGDGHLLTDDGLKPFAEGQAVFVPPKAMHQFQNTGTAPLQFLCMIPNSGDCQ